MEMQKLMETKKKLHKARPHFVRQDYSFRMRVHDDIWRKPRGKHSKMRRGEAGKKKVVQMGYRSPVALRGINLRGFRVVHVETMQQLEKLNAKTEMAIISGKLGLKKRIELVKKAAEKSILLANIRDAKKFLVDVEAKLKAKKEAKKAAATKPKAEEKKTKEEKPKAETKEKKPEVKSAEAEKKAEVAKK